MKMKKAPNKKKQFFWMIEILLNKNKKEIGKKMKKKEQTELNKLVGFWNETGQRWKLQRED